MKSRLAVVDGIRTPFCKAGGCLKSVEADDLGAYAVKELLARHAVERVDEVVFGSVAQPIHAANIARVIALKAGLPVETTAHTVQRNCASGMQAFTSAWQLIETGGAEVAVVGGTESMSNIPLIYGPEMTALFSRLARAKTIPQKLRAIGAFRLKHLQPVIALQQGLTDPVCGLIMGLTAERLSREFQITREQQDEYALQSHRKATAAGEAGKLAEEIVPVPVPPTFGSIQVVDEGPRPQQSMEDLQKLRPYFDRKTGTVTVGNSSQVTDGAVAALVMSEEKAKALGHEPLGYIRDYRYAALEGERMGLGPVYATARLMDATGLALSDFELIELNEAFAAQVLACERAFSSHSFAQEFLGRDSAVGTLDMAKVNVNGGAIALGHPVGATGARLLITLLKEMRRQNKQLGLATLCVGGGQGAAFALEVE
ncbi:thiolase family protein [Pontiella sp.]|uniref:thiolase family protein n=1 Tax=Pontiella sp. TaxID=2837462 RepID=UPI0035685FA3